MSEDAPAPIRPCIVVAGLGRCGSSLTMQMLHAAGVPCMGAYPDFEDDAFASGRRQMERLSSLSDCAVKILDAWRAPATALTHHVVIWLRRDPDEQARSMLKFAGAPMHRHNVRGIKSKLAIDTRLSREGLGVAPVGTRSPLLRHEFEDLIQHPLPSSRRIAAFLAANGWPDLDAEKMAAQVRPRSPKCLPGFLEFDLL